MEKVSLYKSHPPEKKQFKNKISLISGGLLIYTFIMYAVVFLAMIIVLIASNTIASMSNNYIDSESIISWYYETDMAMGISVIIGSLFMLLFNHKYIKVKELFKTSQKMTISKFIMILCLLMSLQLPISLFDVFFEIFLNIIGFSAQTAIESSQAGSTTISMLLYAGFIGPLAEEFIYRGYVMHSLKKTGAGKGYALIISSLLFGIMHANPTQSIYAFFAGLVFSYTAMEYGIIWSILLHISNNFLFGDVMVFICNRLPESIATLLNLSFFLGFFIAGLIILIVYFRKAILYIRENYLTRLKYYSWTFTNILFLTFLGINIFMAITSITKLE